jgi:signal transduction histidine kinase
MAERSPRYMWFLFGALALYMALQSAWWCYLLVRKDQELEQLVSAFDLRPAEHSIRTGDATRTLWMVVGEGVVFLLLLLLALWLTYRAVRHELTMARTQSNFLLAASHELRTPIAGMKLHLQTLLREGVDPSSQKEVVLRALGDAERLAALSEKVLLAARMDDGAWTPAPQYLATDVIVHELVEAARRSFARGHTVAISGVGANVRADPLLLRSIIGNLLENACKYAPPGTTVLVELAEDHSHVMVRVLDEGPGVAPEDRPHVFKKFYRAGQETTRETKGTGLGLYIAAQAARLMGGVVTHQPRPTGGSIFTAQFPLHA